GFQVLLTEYPEAKEQLNYNDLDLQAFRPGAMVLHAKGKSLVADPFREPTKLFSSLFAPVGTLQDKLKLLRLRRDLKEVPVDHLFRMPELKTWEYLRSKDFSESMLYKFFLPFMRGIYLEKDLNTSSRMFDFVFKMFSEGNTTVPSLGMEEIPKQLVNALVRTEIKVKTKVMAVEGSTVRTTHGELLSAKKVLVACEPNEFVNPFNPVAPDDMHSTVNLYFTADKSPESKPYLILNGSREGVVNNVVVMSQVSDAYAPRGSHLISVSLLGQFESDDETLAHHVKSELKTWYGEEVEKWQLLKTYRIDKALPKLNTVRDQAPSASFKMNDHLFATGDYMLNGSIHGALKAGRLAAEAILEDF
ncbi:MAG TPA: FAD-dependent oxidoreductase, partial [Cytophagales bacterium]|nr:FAD-dependent oxidoreductase [Cytophagales bacterium]